MKISSEEVLFSLKTPKRFGERGFNIHEAYVCLQLSQVAYMTLGRQTKVLKKNKFKNFKSFSKENTYAFSCTRDGILYIAFRGTDFDNVQDLADNLDFKKIKFGKGKIHAGYKKHLDRIWVRLMKHIAKSKYEKIIVTGHSMGGAVGQLVNYQLPDTMGYYFGSPQCVDEDMKKSNKSYVYNIQNQYDLVTNLPPRLFFGFRLLGQKFILEYGKLYPRTRSLKEYFYAIFYMFAFLFLKLFSSIFGVQNKLKDILLRNHQVLDYHRNLEAYLVEEEIAAIRNSNKLKK